MLAWATRSAHRPEYAIGSVLQSDGQDINVLVHLERSGGVLKRWDRTFPSTAPFQHEKRFALKEAMAELRQPGALPERHANELLGGLLYAQGMSLLARAESTNSPEEIKEGLKQARDALVLAVQHSPHNLTYHRELRNLTDRLKTPTSGPTSGGAIPAS